MKHKKEVEKKTISLFLITILFITLSFSLIIAQEDKDEFNKDKPETWPQDTESFKATSAEDKETPWKEASSFIKQYAVSQIAKDIRDLKIKQVKQANTVGGLIGLEPLDTPSELKMTGFDHPNLKWGEGLTIGNGETWIDLENIPSSVSEVEYKIDKELNQGVFIFQDTNGNIIKIAKGSINEDLELVGVEGYENAKIILEENQEISFLSEGLYNEGFYLKGGAKVQIGNTILTNNPNNPNAPSSFSVAGNNHLFTQNMRITTPTAVIDTPASLTDTDVFLRAPFSDDKSTQGVWLYSDKIQKMTGTFNEDGTPTGKIGTIETIEINNAKIVGEGIDITLKDDFSLIEADGNNLKVINGDLTTEIKGEKTFTNRNNFKGEFNVGNIRNLQDGVYEVETEVTPPTNTAETPETPTKPEPVKPKPVETTPPKPEVKPEAKTEIKTKYDSKKWVCIGRFCEVGDIIDLGKSKFGIAIELAQKPINYKAGKTEQIISKTEIYAYEGEILKLLDEAPRGLSKSKFGEWATKYLDNNKIITVLHATITQEQIDKNIDKMLGPLGLPQKELERIGPFKAKIYQNLPTRTVGLIFKEKESYVPTYSRVVTLSKSEGKEKRGAFSLELNINRKYSRPYSLSIPGNYIEKAVNKGYKKFGEKPYTINKVYSEYRLKK